MSFSISVIIPAYNVERFIEKAINSAFEQEEVGEVVVVDDGSTDNTVAVIKELQKTCSRIKFFNHPNFINKGRSITRNLGIQKATENYIAFLDGDDFYMANRFKKDSEIFEKEPFIEGVYNAVGFHYYRTASENEKAHNKISTLSRKIVPEELFDAVISSKYGYLHLNGLTVKKTVFDKIGHFNENLLVAEDSDIIYKLALKCKLLASNIEEPLAKRGVHENNIFDKKEIYTKYNPVLYEGLVSWCLKNNLAFYNIDSIFKYYWIVRYRENYTLFNETTYWMYYLIKNPKILFSKYSLKYFPIIRLRQMLFPFLYTSKN